MAEPVSARITGTASVDRAMQTVIDGADDPPGTWQAIANLVVGQARGLAPRRTGRLAGSIGASAIGRGAGTAGVVYGGVIEWGWAAHGIGGRHYLGRAVMSNQEQIRELYEQGLDRGVRRRRRPAHERQQRIATSG